LAVLRVPVPTRRPICRSSRAIFLRCGSWAGGGSFEGALRQQANAVGVFERIVFAGERSSVADLLPAFDVFAMPSLTEGLSIALLEACAAGLPVVATAVGGNPEITGSSDRPMLENWFRPRTHPRWVRPCGGCLRTKPCTSAMAPLLGGGCRLTPPSRRCARPMKCFSAVLWIKEIGVERSP
jgi:Glycosyl transferases group 1